MKKKTCSERNLVIKNLRCTLHVIPNVLGLTKCFTMRYLRTEDAKLSRFTDIIVNPSFICQISAMIFREFEVLVHI